MGVDYTRAQIPERAYYADYCNVAQSRVGFTLTFGKLAASQDSLRTKIEVIFPEQMFHKQLWGTTASLRETIKSILEGRKLEPLGNVSDTEKVQTFRSNNVFMAIWGEEGVMDFYYISPRDYFLFHQQSGTDIGLEPVVRVVMDTALMSEFLDLCFQFAREEKNQGRAEEEFKEILEGNV